MKETVRRTLLVVIGGPVVLVLVIGWCLTTIPAMACLNWLIGGKGGFWPYMREVRQELFSELREDIRGAWHPPFSRRQEYGRPPHL